MMCRIFIPILLISSNRKKIEKPAKNKKTKLCSVATKKKSSAVDLNQFIFLYYEVSQLLYCYSRENNMKTEQ